MTVPLYHPPNTAFACDTVAVICIALVFIFEKKKTCHKLYQHSLTLPRLLETGSTALIRNTAADQLADVQKQHPDELFNLLTRVIPYLRSKSWETRVAAAKAVGGIVSNAEKFDPNAEDEPIEAGVKAEDVETETNGHVKAEDSNGAIVKKEENGDTAIPPLSERLDLATLGFHPQVRQEACCQWNPRA
jgi:hypothetical protein